MVTFRGHLAYGAHTLGQVDHHAFFGFEIGSLVAEKFATAFLTLNYPEGKWGYNDDLYRSFDVWCIYLGSR